MPSLSGRQKPVNTLGVGEKEKVANTSLVPQATIKAIGMKIKLFKHLQILRSSTGENE